MYVSCGMTDAQQDIVRLNHAAGQEVDGEVDTYLKRGMSARCKSLFSCCFKDMRRQRETAIDYNPDEYDYIVEKLIVRRVPLALFATPQDYSEHKSDSIRQNKNTLLPATFTSQVYPVTAESGPSLNRNLAVTQNVVINQNSCFYKNVEEDTNVISNDCYSYVERKTIESKLLDRFNVLHPDLKESERPPSDPLHESKRSLAKVKEILAEQKNFQDSSSIMHIDDHVEARDEPKVACAFDCHKMDAGSCTSFAHSISEVSGSNNGKVAFNFKQTDNTLSASTQTLQKESVNAENVKENDLSSGTLKWKIIIKRHESNVDKNDDDTPEKA